MKHLHQGLDYRLYKVYIWGGLPLIVVHMLVSALVFDVLDLPNPQVFLVLLGPFFLIWFAGIILYWWWVFLFKGNGELEELSQVRGQGFRASRH
jgi:hypothetical protein